MQTEEIKVTKINQKYHCRLFIDNKLFMEYACIYKLDIQWCCREMMRTADKMGFSSKRTHSSRMRYEGKRESKLLGNPKLVYAFWWNND